MDESTRDAPPAPEEEPRASQGGTSDHRASDVIAGRVPEEELDPATIAQLAAWFGAPLPAQEAGPRPGFGEDPEIREVRERRQRAAALVDPEFLARFESKPAEAQALIRLPESLRLSIEERPLAKLDMDAWNLALSPEIREHERPDDISDALQERTPQALLRDLHRPEMYWQITMKPRSLGVDTGGTRGRARVAAAIQTRYAFHRGEMPLATRLAAAGMADLRSRLAEPWENAYVPPEKRRSPGSYVPTPEDLRWFGLGGYDPDL